VTRGRFRGKTEWQTVVEARAKDRVERRWGAGNDHEGYDTASLRREGLMRCGLLIAVVLVGSGCATEKHCTKPGAVASGLLGVPGAAGV
jgi:hypothetical protein